jgi:hypothetical protein
MKNIKTFLFFVTALNLYACGNSDSSQNYENTPIPDTTAPSSTKASNEANPRKAHSFYPSIAAMIDSSND